jgi:hypothetical protein
MTKITLIYGDSTTVIKELEGEGFEDVHQALWDACLALGFSPDTVNAYFDIESIVWELAKKEGAEYDESDE